MAEKVTTNRRTRRAKPEPVPNRDEQARLDAIKAAAERIELLGAPELTLSEAVIFKAETGFEPLDYIAAQNASVVRDFDGEPILIEVPPDPDDPDAEPKMAPMMAQPPTAVVRVLHMLWHRRHGKPEYTLAEAGESMKVGDLLGEVAESDPPTEGD